MTPWYRGPVTAAAAHAGLDPRLVEAVVVQESSGRADAFRHEPAYYRDYLAGKPAWAGWHPRRCGSSYGLMQVMFPTAVELGYRGEPEGLFDVRTNLQYGCAYLRRLIDRFGLTNGIAAYNGGPGNYRAPKPQAYSREVLARYQVLKAAGAQTAA